MSSWPFTFEAEPELEEELRRRGWRRRPILRRPVRRPFVRPPGSSVVYPAPVYVEPVYTEPPERVEEPVDLNPAVWLSAASRKC